MTRSIYLDHHATTPLDPRALEAMTPYFTEEFGNASSSTHDWGHRAAEAVKKARGAVAGLIGADADEIVFTAGATESNNLAVAGGARSRARAGRGRHLITTAIEHKSVLLTMGALQEEGFGLTVIPPDAEGIVTADAIRSALRPDTVLVSVTAACGEMGALQPVDAIGALCREHGILFHTDATQLVGKLPYDVDAVPTDLLSLSAHKIYGPKGVGALYVRRGVDPLPVIIGGGQEFGLRSGTLNVPGIVGLGATCAFRREEMHAEAERLTALRTDLWRAIRENIPGVVLNGSERRRLPGNLNVSFTGCDGEALIMALSEFALSSGSACQSAKKIPSEVLLALGREPGVARAAVRFGLGKSTRREDLDLLVRRLIEEVTRLRSLAPQIA
jgi:cysteine desulfurase